MRRFFFVIFVLALTVAAHAASYEARSLQHAVTVDVVPLQGIDVRYDMKITDLATGEVLASPQLTAKRGLLAATQLDVRDLHLRVEVGDTGRLIANVEIEKGEDIIDLIQVSWSTGPQKAVTRTDAGVLRVGGDVKAPVVMHRPDPVYPEDARKARVSGIVTVEAIVTRDGVVKSVSVLKHLPRGLDEAAVDAVKQWTFKPGTLDGQPVEVAFDLMINFRL
jgi:TonB family protein